MSLLNDIFTILNVVILLGIMLAIVAVIIVVLVYTILRVVDLFRD